VRTLAGEVGAGNLGFKPRLKVLLASLPKPLRAPLTSLAGRASSSIAPQGKSSP